MDCFRALVCAEPYGRHGRGEYRARASGGLGFEGIRRPFPRVPNGAKFSAPASRAVLATLSKRELEQVHLCIGVPSVPLSDERRYAVAVLNTILGGGMSSRLFQNIRERQGLAYAVFSELSPYSDAGFYRSMRARRCE